MNAKRGPIWAPARVSTADHAVRGGHPSRDQDRPSPTQRRRRSSWVVRAGIVAAGLVALLAGGILVAQASSPPDLGPSYDPTSLPGLQMGGPPWPPETAHLRQRLLAMGLPVLATEGAAVHIHEHLDLFVDGKAVAVPADIGIDTSEGFLSPVHTHDTSGIIHVESPVVRGFTLGQFFDVWGLVLDDDCVGIQCDGDGRLQYTWVNGQPYAGNPRDIVLTAHEEIVIAVGTPAQMPNPVPSSYAFPAGL
jgi:hypothetical protein